MINGVVLKAMRGGARAKATDGGGGGGGGGDPGGIGCGALSEAGRTAVRKAYEAHAKALMGCAKLHPNLWFAKPFDAKKLPGYAQEVPEPLDFKTIGVRAARYESVLEFARDCRRVFANARAYHSKRQHFSLPPAPVDEAGWAEWTDTTMLAAEAAAESAAIVIAADLQEDAFSEALVELKEMLLRTALKAGVKGIATRRESEAMRIKELTSSTATLVVVPRPLHSHWMAQIKLHVDKRYVPSSAFWFDGDAGRNQSESSTIGQQGSWRDLPHATFLAGRLIVLVTNERLSREGTELGRESPLQQIHWRSVVIDEVSTFKNAKASIFRPFLSSS